MISGVTVVVLQQIPLSVMAFPPFEVMLPPPLAVVGSVTEKTGTVVVIPGTDFVVK